MESIFRGDLHARWGRTTAWLDSLLIDHGALRLLWRNWGEVIPGQFYRSNHPPPWQLKRAKRTGVRSVINLRGATRSGSDALSREASARLGLAFFDMPLSSGRAPPRDTVLALIDTLRAAPRPALLHCKSGADRAGFAAAIAILLDGGSADTALRQLSWRFGHLRRSRTGVLDAVLLRYKTLAEGRLTFPDWVASEYDPDAVTRDFKANGLANFLNTRMLARE